MITIQHATPTVLEIISLVPKLQSAYDSADGEGKSKIAKIILDNYNDECQFQGSSVSASSYVKIHYKHHQK